MIKIYIRSEPAFNRTELFIFDEDESGERRIVKPVEIVFEHQDDTKVPEPTISLCGNEGRCFLMELANALVESGYRDKAVDVRGEIRRMENHLEDMRKLVFNKKPEANGYDSDGNPVIYGVGGGKA